MKRITRASVFRRLASLSFVALLAVAAIGPASVSATTPSAADVSVLERSMVSALNANRTALGLVPVQIDTRLMAIARARSADMIAKDYFSHVQPDGRNVFAILRETGIKWYGAGEVLAWNNYPLDETVATANRQWMNSPGHKAIVISPSYNYVGVGLALDPDTGKKMWTAVYMKGPDRTAARAFSTGATVSSGPTASTRYARVTWKGWDPLLQVLTAGFDSFIVERRIDDGPWLSVATATTLRYTTFQLGVGHRHEFRVAARDNAGNLGAWTVQAVDLR